MMTTASTSLANDVLEACKAAKLKIATAESCTGGMVSAALIDIPGSSVAMLGGIVAYSNGAKQKVLGVRADTIRTHGAVSEETAVEMATGALAQMDADITVGITGVAGPGGSGTKPEGMVCFAVARRGASPVSETVQFGAIGRDNVRAGSRDHALGMLLKSASA